MRSLANSEDPDELPHKVAFHQGLHCLLKHKQSCNFCLEIVTSDPSVLTMVHPMFIVPNQKEESISS